MRYLLAMYEDRTYHYLSTSGSLTTNKQQATVFHSRSNAELAKEKWQRKQRRIGDKRTIYLMPLREG